MAIGESRKNVLHDMSMNLDEAKVMSGMMIGQPFMIKYQTVHYCREYESEIPPSGIRN